MKQTPMLSKRFKSIMVVDKKGKTKEILKKNREKYKGDILNDNNNTSIETTNVKDPSCSYKDKYDNLKEEDNDIKIEEHTHECMVSKENDLISTTKLLSSNEDPSFRNFNLLNKCDIHDDTDNKNKKSSREMLENDVNKNRGDKSIVIVDKDEEHENIFHSQESDNSSSDYKSIDEENSADVLSINDRNEFNSLLPVNKEKSNEIESNNKHVFLPYKFNTSSSALENLTLSDYTLSSNNNLDGSKKLILTKSKLKEINKGEKTIKRKSKRKDKMNKNTSNSSNEGKKGLKDKIIDKVSDVKENVREKANVLVNGNKNDESKDNSTHIESTTVSRSSERTNKKSGNNSEISSKIGANGSDHSSISSKSSSSSISNSRSSSSTIKNGSTFNSSRNFSSTSNSKSRGCCCTNNVAKDDKEERSSSSNVKKNLALVNNKMNNSDMSTQSEDKKMSDSSKNISSTTNTSNASRSSRDVSDQRKEAKTINSQKDASLRTTDSSSFINNTDEEKSKENSRKDYPSYVKKYTNDPLEEDKIMVPEKHPNKASTNSSSAKKSLAAGAVGVAGAGIILGKGKDAGSPKSVSIDEKKNEEFEVKKDSNKSNPLSSEEKIDGKAGAIQTNLEEEFVPMKISSTDLGESSEILRDRRDNIIVCEGHMWKRRRIFACFWHEKYFILDKEGILRYHKANGTKAAKGLWNIKEVRRIHELFVGTENHPYRLAMICDRENLIFAFDDPDTREYWYKNLSSFIGG